MFYEDYVIAPRDTLWNIAIAYGYKGAQWEKIWNDPRNAGLRHKRGAPDRIQPADLLLIPIPWMITSSTLSAKPDGGEMTAQRDGELGKQLTWVQTVYRHNQPIGPNPNPFCVDACTPDDDLPFYFTDAEIKADPERRRAFYDYSRRGAPTQAMGTTRWRAVLSLAVVTKRRVTVWDSTVWGWDMTPAKAVTIIGPRAATQEEVAGHINLQRKGLGTGPLAFGKDGWTFRAAPP